MIRFNTGEAGPKMRVAAFSLAGIPLEHTGDYAGALAALFKELRVELAVLPAHTSFLLYLAGGGAAGAGDFARAFRSFMQRSEEWNKHYLQIHSGLAGDCGLYLVAGTTVEEDGGRYFQTSHLFGPQGRICGSRRQTHLNREERALGLSRGEDLQLFDLGGMKMGLIIGADARHPEVGRIMALEGADLVAHSGALPAGVDSLTQPAGIWAQVQQNQFWAVEAQPGVAVCNRSFGARCAVMGSCEITPGLTGYLDQSTADRAYALAELEEAERQRIKGDYPLLNLLRPEAYRGCLPDLYR